MRAAPQREVVGEAAQEGGQRAELVRDVLERRARAEGHLPCWNAKVYSNSAAALGRGSVAVALVFATIGFVALQAQLS